MDCIVVCRVRGGVNYLDNALDEIRSELEKKDMWDDTLVIFTSDNGGPLEVGTGHTYHDNHNSISATV